MIRKTRPQIVIGHLLSIGRITDATARAAYGSFDLAHAVWRLRGNAKHLVPEGMEIITMDRYDAMGNLFAEYRLVPKGLPRFITCKPAYSNTGVRNAA
jgi:hypothetical protein